MIGTLRGKQQQRLVENGLRLLELAVREICLSQRAVELRHSRIFAQQRLQIGYRSGRIARIDVGDRLAVAVFDD